MTKFIPPTVDDAAAYAKSLGCRRFRPYEFIDYYETRGWFLKGNVKMRSWQGAVRTFCKTELAEIRAREAKAKVMAEYRTAIAEETQAAKVAKASTKEEYERGLAAFLRKSGQWMEPK